MMKRLTSILLALRMLVGMALAEETPDAALGDWYALPSDEAVHRLTLREDGTFFFGGINGFNYFSPFNISVNKVRPEIVISSVRMHRADSFSVGSERQTLPDGNLRISSKTLSFDINFECLSYVAPGQNRYAWKLEGFNSDWVYTDQHSVSFMKLPAGRYVFRVRGCNNDGYWSDATRSLEISVQPHPILSPDANGD